MIALEIGAGSGAGRGLPNMLAAFEDVIDFNGKVYRILRPRGYERYDPDTLVVTEKSETVCEGTFHGNYRSFHCRFGCEDGQVNLAKAI